MLTSESSLDFGYNDAPYLKTPITGELISVPKEIIISSRNNQYFEESDTLLIAESNNNEFECEKWSEIFRNSPHNSKFNDAVCINENDKGNNVKRLYAIQSPTKERSKSGLKLGAIVGIAIVPVVFVVAIIILVVYFIAKKTKDNSANSTKEDLLITSIYDY